jgi:hypothetical protein
MDDGRICSVENRHAVNQPKQALSA